jgi:hypothetical protein
MIQDLKYDRLLFLLLFGVFFLALPACGMKGPPFLPKGRALFEVQQLTGEWEDGEVYLKGHVVPPRGSEKNTTDVLSCRIYHARYDLEDPPCEDCPIEYNMFKDIKTEVMTGNNFHCRVPWIKEKGVHFFKVRLLGPKEVLGPPSNEVKLTIEK